MSDDLISRKAVLDILTEVRVKDSILCSPAFVEMLTQRIKKIPTAFDKEKVIEKLKRLEKDTFDYYNRYNDEMSFGESAAFRSAIEIVEKGGIEWDEGMGKKKKRGWLLGR